VTRSADRDDSVARDRQRGIVEPAALCIASEDPRVLYEEAHKPDPFMSFWVLAKDLRMRHPTWELPWRPPSAPVAARLPVVKRPGWYRSTDSHVPR
jgi:hypothetical protein